MSSAESKTIDFLKNNYAAFMHLKLFVDSEDTVLTQKYVDAIQAHNNNLIYNYNIDAGFDLYCPPLDSKLSLRKVNKIDFLVKCEAQMIHGNSITHNTGYYMYPRSSLSKTPLRLANSVGIIDAAYRGHIMGMFDLHNVEQYVKGDYYAVDSYARLVQICAPGLVPIYVEMVDSESALSPTSRGEGGFGSTGL